MIFWPLKICKIDYEVLGTLYDHKINGLRPQQHYMHYKVYLLKDRSFNLVFIQVSRADALNVDWLFQTCENPKSVKTFFFFFSFFFLQNLTIRFLKQGYYIVPSKPLQKKLITRLDCVNPKIDTPSNNRNQHRKLAHFTENSKISSFRMHS